MPLLLIGAVGGGLGLLVGLVGGGLGLLLLGRGLGGGLGVVVVIVAAADEGEAGGADAGASGGAEEGAPAHAGAAHALPVVAFGVHAGPPILACGCWGKSVGWESSEFGRRLCGGGPAAEGKSSGAVGRVDSEFAADFADEEVVDFSVAWDGGAMVAFGAAPPGVAFPSRIC